MAEVRLINANALCQHIQDWKTRCQELHRHSVGMYHMMIYEVLCKVLDVINDTPTIDPENLRPVAHWEESTCLDDSFWACSNCQFQSEAIAAPVLYHYCPHCGARMEDATNEQTEIS